MRIGPVGRVAEGADPETVVAASSCASEGIVEVLVEPQLAEPLLAVVGESPAAETLYFCASGCRSRYEAEPARYLTLQTP